MFKNSIINIEKPDLEFAFKSLEGFHKVIGILLVSNIAAEDAVIFKKDLHIDKEPSQSDDSMKHTMRSRIGFVV